MEARPTSLFALADPACASIINQPGGALSD